MRPAQQAAEYREITKQINAATPDNPLCSTTDVLLTNASCWPPVSSIAVAFWVHIGCTRVGPGVHSGCKQGARGLCDAGSGCILGANRVHIGYTVLEQAEIAEESFSPTISRTGADWHSSSGTQLVKGPGRSCGKMFGKVNANPLLLNVPDGMHIWIPTTVRQL